MATTFTMPSMFDTRYAMDRQMQEDAMAAATNLGGGKRGGMYYNSSLGGDTRNAGLMSLAGLFGGGGDPRMQKQMAIDSVMQQYPNPETAQDFINISGALRQSGLYEEADRAFTMANEIKENEKVTQTQTTYMQDIRDIAKFQLACDFNDPECAKKAQALWLDQKRAGADERGNIKYAEEEMEAFSKSLTQSTEDYQKALYYGNTIDQSLGFLDSGLYTGTGAETINKFKQFGMAFGMVDDGATATAEQFKVNSMKAIMAWVQKTKGAISEAEMNLFAEASEGLARSKAGNKLILLTAKSLAEYQKNLHRERLKWEEETENPTRRKWLIHKANWDLKNGNTVPSADEIAAALGPDNVESEVIENENVVITEVPLGG
tara:strand:+ start:468 stop:1595 length:1128 start_codon:yes stop_codon:yes gene_type:complete